MTTMLDLTAHLQTYSQTYGNTTIHMANGKIHRDHGPAVEHPTYRMWYVNGVVHREDGPAIMYLKHPQPSPQAGNGELIAEWFFHGKFQMAEQLDDHVFNTHWNWEK